VGYSATPMGADDHENAWLETLPSSGDPHIALFGLLEEAVARKVFPGCVAMVCKDGATVYEEAHGTLADHPASIVRGEPVARDTIYDLASLTKVLCTTSLVALSVSEGKLALDEPVPEPWSNACPGARLVDVLEHCAGLRAHREYFTEVSRFDRDRVIELVCETAPTYPLRERAVYSDLGFIILGAWLERLYGESLDRIFADRIAYPLDLEGSNVPALGFRRLFSDVRLASHTEKLIAPTEVYDPALHPAGSPSYLAIREHAPVAHGAVHDDNAYVMGGVAGHAGLFGTAAAVREVARAWLELLLPGLRPEVRDRFWQKSTVSGSTRRLGFDGPSPGGGGSTGHATTEHAVGHLGFTGTSLWIDPAAKGGARIFVLLSNRVHPTRDNDAIRRLRPRFHELAMRL
jgi:serine-type D-Ala-D-Ala carboxypeptidase